MMNRTVLVGRLTKDVELRYTPNGVPVANFTLAVNRTFTNQQGEREADFINCVVWRKPAENAAKFLKKGSQAGIDGRLQTRNYEDDSGKRVFVTEVVADSVQFLEPKSRDQQRDHHNSNNQGDYRNGQQNKGQGQQRNHYKEDYQSSPNGSPFDHDPYGSSYDYSQDDLPF